MNMNAIARHYGRLTAEERFGLIVAAGARGDEAERTRLLAAGQRITLSMSDHAPVAHAFDELALLTFIEIMDTATSYLDLLQFAKDAPSEDVCEEDSEAESEDGEAEGSEGQHPHVPNREPATDVDAGEAHFEREELSLADRAYDLALATGFMLNLKGESWKLFCERIGVPPFACWKGLPGFYRLQHALKVAENAAFLPEGMVRYFNNRRPDGDPPVTVMPFTAETTAASLERLFRERVAWWGGE